MEVDLKKSGKSHFEREYPFLVSTSESEYLNVPAPGKFVLLPSIISSLDAT